MKTGNKEEGVGNKTATDPVSDTLSQRQCNVILRKAMNACANAFLPDRSELQERAEDAGSVETMRELFAEFIADMTEYGAMAGAHQLRKAAHAKEDDQVNAVMAAYKLIGAPGDFGYETPRGKTWHALLKTYDAVLNERMAVLDAEAAASDLPQAPVEKKACPVDGEECDRCHGCRNTACKDAPEKMFRVASTRHGDVGEETHYLRIIDRDGDPDVFFSDSAAVAWQGPSHKAAMLVDLIKEATGDGTVRVEEVRHG
jgi:hypothetical protein